MHMMLFYIIYFDRTEGSKSYVKCHMCDLDALCLHLLQKFFREVKSGCRCCCGAVVLGIYGLITVLVF